MNNNFHIFNKCYTTELILNSLFLILFIIFSFGSTFACDTTPTLTGSNVIDNGDGTYYMDISACIGSGGSADGFDLYFNNDINVLATTVTQVTSPTLNNVADVSVNNGIWLATFDEFNNSGTYFETGGFGIDCIEFGIIVDSNPEGSTICSLGINEDCLGFTQQTEFITCGSVQGHAYQIILLMIMDQLMEMFYQRVKIVILLLSMMK